MVGVVGCGWLLVGWLKWLVGRGWWLVGGWLVVVGLWFHGTGTELQLSSQLESLVGFLGYVYLMKSVVKCLFKKTDSSVKRIVVFRHQLV